MRRFPNLLLVPSLMILATAALASPPHHPHLLALHGMAPRPILIQPPALFTAYPPVAYRPMMPRQYPLSRQPPSARPAERRRGLPRTPPQETGRNAGEDAPPHPPAAKASRTEPDTPKDRRPESDTDHRTAFLKALRPLVENENARLLELRQALTALSRVVDAGGGLDEADQARLRGLARRYRVSGDPLDDARARRDLIDKIDAVPVSLALAQAANESDWGRSRFAREGNNLFGIWTYDESKGMVPRKRSPGQKHLVRRFDSIEDSVRYYMFTLNSHPAYAEFRDIRAGLRAKNEPLDGHTMADGLLRYSAKGEDYVRAIRSMIRRFELAAFDAGGREA